jgi:hypothetical protein
MTSDPRGSSEGTIIGGKPRTGGDRFGLRRSSRDSIEPKVEEMPAQNLESPWQAGDDEPGAEYDRLREHLRGLGMSEDQIEGACNAARDDVRRRGSNGCDRHADDFLPKNRLQGGPGGRFGGERRATDWATPEEEASGKFLIDHGLDGRRHRGGADRQAIDSARKLMRRYCNRGLRL